jgi:hypothetical protein
VETLRLQVRAPQLYPDNPPYGIFRGDDGNVGIIRSPIRAIVLLDHELHTTAVFTLDRRDFSVYRVGRRAFRILPAST